MKKFIASLLVLGAVNNCVAMNKSHCSHKNKPLITSSEVIKTPSKENIRINLHHVGLDHFCAQSKIDEKLADQKLSPVTIVGYINGYLKECGYEPDSSAQSKIVKIMINNDTIYNQLIQTRWISPNSSMYAPYMN